MRPVLDRLAEKHRGKIAPVLFIVSLLIYLLTISSQPSPGEPAKLIVEHLGLDPFPPLGHFLWGAIANLFALLPLGSTVFMLNLFSALCGAGVVAMMYALVSRIPRDRTAEENEARFPMEALQVLSGIVAAGYLAVCTPFWVVSNRARTDSFDVLLLLAAVWLTIRFLETKQFRFGCISALVFGLGMTEFATFIPLAPVYVLMMAFILWRSGLFRPGHVVAVLLCGVIGLAPYFLGALRYLYSPAFEWRQFGGYWVVVWFILRDQWLELRYSVPQVGWLLIFLVNVLPWIIVVAAPKRAMTRSAVLGSQFMHALFGVLSVAILFNAPIAPWPLLGTRPLLVMPYVLTAMWAGYIAGYWYLFFYQSSRFEVKGRAKIRAMGRHVYLLALAAILIGAGAYNLPEANGRAGDATAEFARAVVDDAQGREWLISNGIVDDMIVLAAAEQQVPLRVINATQAGGAYLRYLADQFENPRLRGLAQVGLAPLIAEWFSTDAGVTGSVAVLSASDLWTAEGLQPVPEGLLYFGAKDLDGLDADAYFARQQKLWDGLGAKLAAAAGRKNPAQPWNQWLLTHVSKAANNAGVLLEDVQRRDLAFKAYEAARGLDTNNISALLNMLEVAHADSLPEKDALEAEFEAFANRLRSRLRIWSLAQFYGYVRRPEAFASRGWAWAMSGKHGAGMKEIQRAVASGADRQQADYAMASLYLMQGMDREGEQLYLAMLEENPQNMPALISLLHLAMRNNDVRTAAGYLARLRELGAPADMLAMEEAGIELMDGNATIAEEILLKLVESQPKLLRAWSLLALISTDAKVREKAEAVLASEAVNEPEVLLVMAHTAMNRREFRPARGHIERLLQIQPANVQAMEMQLGLDVMESRRDLAEQHLEQLLKVDPRNAYANFILGSIQYARGEIELAETSYRVSISTKPMADALNDLAWILQRKGNLTEALALIEQSLAMGEDSAPAWDTKGVILTNLGRLDEAKAALERALVLRPGAASLVLHMAQLYLRMGMRDEALRLADPLLARPAELPPDDYDELRKLMLTLRSGE